MRVAVFSTKPYDASSLVRASAGAHDLLFFDARLTLDAAPMAAGADAVCAFVNDDLGERVISALADVGVSIVALRSAGFNHVDLAAAEAAGISVARVPAYSPHAVAEHTVAMMLTLNRRRTAPTTASARATSRSRDCSASTCTARPWASSAWVGSARSSPVS
jgi:D-lactate dehydrogenase